MRDWDEPGWVVGVGRGRLRVDGPAWLEGSMDMISSSTTIGGVDFRRVGGAAEGTTSSSESDEGKKRSDIVDVDWCKRN